MHKLLKSLIELSKVLITVLICSVIAVCLMTLAFMIPMNRENLETSVNLGVQEGYYVDALEHIPSLEKYFSQFQPGTMTVADDVRGFHMAEDHEGFNALENALYCNDYPRYWHGYVMIMRLLFLFFDYKEMRFINLIFQAFLALCIFQILREKGEKKISWFSLIWYIFMMPISVACCLVYGCVVDAIFALTIFVMLKGDKIWNNHSKLGISFCVIGCIVCFFDLLIFSPMGWAMPLAMIVILYGKNDSVIHNLIKTVWSAVSWFLGYGLFWILKMLYAQLIIGDKIEVNVFRGALSEAVWSAAKKDTEAVGLFAKIADRWSAVQTNYTHYSYTIYALLILIMSLVVIIWFIKMGTNVKGESRLLPLLIVTSSPVIWVFVINTATKAHHCFDYRLMSTEICCSVVMIILSINFSNRKFVIRECFKRICVIVGLLAIGIILAMQIRESQYSMNADKLGMQDIVISDADVLLMDFSPAFNEVAKLGLSVTPESDKGEIKLMLIEEGNVIKEVSAPMSDFIESSWQMLDVDWKLSNRRMYELGIQAINADETVTVTVLPYITGGTISELGNIVMNSESLDCQLVSWVEYSRRPSNKNVLTYGMIISGYLSAFTLTIFSMIRYNKQDKSVAS
ncbi:MAG: hypothetical protein K6G27_14150 [Lachnospiraceae bacterium]|nr:hypothetical protein [Lachnospiraceae bacterium]